MLFKEFKKYTDEDLIEYIVVCHRDEDFQEEYDYHYGGRISYDDLEVYRFEPVLVKETDYGDDTSITLLSRLKVYLLEE